MTKKVEKKDSKGRQQAAKKPVAPVRQTSAAKRPQGEPSIYVGPTLRGGRLSRYTVFKGGTLPAHIEPLADEHRAIKRLIVPVSRLAEIESRLRDKSSAEFALFAEADKIFSKGGE